MTTSRMQIKLGTEFSITLPNGREKDFEVINLHQTDADGKPIVFDSLKCQIINSTSWYPPLVYIIDDVNHIIKIKFTDSTIPMTTSLTLLVQGCVSTVVEEKVTNILLDPVKLKEGTIAAASDLWLYMKKSMYLFGGASILLYFMSGSTFGDWILHVWSNLNAGQVIQTAQKMDTRILTNKHEVYNSAAFLEYNALYKRNHGSDSDLSKLYNVVGNGMFVTKYLIIDNYGKTLLLDHGDAKDYCRNIGGRLLEVEELKAYLAGKYLDFENLAWPIRLHEEVPEWTADNVSWDNYWVFVKDKKGLSYSHSGVSFGDVRPLKDGYTLVEADDGVELAFRCGFTEDYYIRSK